jgi:hypothetical protein
MDVQTQFFRRLRSRIPKHLAAENEIAKLLHLDLEAAFRLMRGIDTLSLAQAEQLSVAYHLSLDNLRPQAPTFIPFQYNAINYNASSVEAYFDTIMKEIKNIDLYGTRSLYYAASDLPVFALFQFPELSAFKLFYWAKHVYHLPEFTDAKLALKHFPLEVLQSAERTWKQYLKLPSIEVLSAEVINNVLREIIALWHLGEFAVQKDALLVVKQVGEMVDQIERQAELGKKFHPYLPLPNATNYTLYYTEIGINNNTLLVKSDTGITTYVCQNELNFLNTDNEAFCLHTQKWFYQLIGNAELISQANPELRRLFFSRLRDNVKFVLSEIENA